MPRPGFGVVTMTVGALMLMAVAAKNVRPFIPPPPPNRLIDRTEAFLQRAAYQPVDWYPMGAEVLAKARREDKPILLVVGVDSGAFGRRLDEGFFSDPETGLFLSQRFVMARADALERPEWENAFLPLERVRKGFGQAFQIIVLDPQGRLVDVYARTFDDDSMYDRNVLRKVFAALAEAAKNGRLHAGQARDRAELGAPLKGTEAPDQSAYLTRLVQESEIGPGFGRNLVRVVPPCALTYLLRHGYLAHYRNTVETAIASPLHDILGGGFFRLGLRTREGFTAETDKVAESMAETALVLAQGAAMLNRPALRLAARDAAWGALAMRRNDRIAAMQSAVDAPKGRDPFHTFPPATLRRALPENDERDFAQERLHLRIRENPQAIPFPVSADLRVTDANLYDRVVGQLRNAVPENAPLRSRGLLSVEATVVARLLEAALLLDDGPLCNAALASRDRLDDFIWEGEWQSVIPFDQRNPRLPDRLAIADALLQEHLLTGRVSSFEEGLRIMGNVLTEFKTDHDGLFATCLPKDAILGDLKMPDLLDDGAESATATLIRLCLDYSALAGDRPEGPRLRRAARLTVARYANLQPLNAFSVAGYMTAATREAADTAVFAVGRDAENQLPRLRWATPLTRVYAAFGPIRRDLQRRGPGFYLVRQGRVTHGPLDRQGILNVIPRTSMF